MQIPNFQPNSAESDLQQLEAQLLSSNQDEILEAVDTISMKIKENADKASQNQEYLLWINNICLKLADLIVSNQTKNMIRNEVVERIFKPNAKTIQELLINKDEFLSRISHQFNTNDPQQRISSLKLLTYCPSLLQNRLDIQHQILFLLTTNSVKDPKER